jgi:hypothetical protein
MRDAKDAQYRREDGVWCIDLQLRQAKQLFDLRDPTPFKERDLDPGAVEFLREAMAELPDRAPVRLDVYILDEPEPTLDDAVIRSAIHAYFHHALWHLGGQLRAHLRQGQVALLVGVLVLSAMLSAAKAIQVEPGGSAWKELLKEGLTIGAWVAIWRPIEHFLYDWWPFLEERRLLRRLATLDVEIHWGNRGALSTRSPGPPRRK